MSRGQKLADGICSILMDVDIAAQWQGVGSMFGISIGDVLPRDYGSWWTQTDHGLWESIALRMRDLGVLTDGFIGLFFLSFAHTDEHVEQTLSICREAVCQELA